MSLEATAESAREDDAKEKMRTALPQTVGACSEGREKRRARKAWAQEDFLSVICNKVEQRKGRRSSWDGGKTSRRRQRTKNSHGGARICLLKETNADLELRERKRVQYRAVS